MTNQTPKKQTEILNELDELLEELEIAGQNFQGAYQWGRVDAARKQINEISTIRKHIHEFIEQNFTIKEQ